MLFATHPENDGRIVAEVSFEQKDLAKMIGFHWDSIRRQWYTYDPAVANRAKSNDWKGGAKAARRDRKRRQQHLSDLRVASDKPRHYLSRKGWKTR